MKKNTKYTLLVSRQNKKINWNDIWDGIELARSFKGRQGNLSKSIVKDRKFH
jgi:hypothetical protein